MENSIVPFASHQNFLDPQRTKDGKPYGPARYREIVRERYFISKHTSTSYSDTGDITPTERLYMLEFIAEEIMKQQEMLKNIRGKSK